MTYNIQIPFNPPPSPSLSPIHTPYQVRLSGHFQANHDQPDYQRKQNKAKMRLNALYLITLTLTLTTARALPSNNGIGPIIIEPVDERTNRFVGPGSDLEKCGTDMDCQFLSVRLMPPFVFELSDGRRMWWLMVAVRWWYEAKV